MSRGRLCCRSTPNHKMHRTSSPCLQIHTLSSQQRKNTPFHVSKSLHACEKTPLRVTSAKLHLFARPYVFTYAKGHMFQSNKRLYCTSTLNHETQHTSSPCVYTHSISGSLHRISGTQIQTSSGTQIHTISGTHIHTIADTKTHTISGKQRGVGWSPRGLE